MATAMTLVARFMSMLAMLTIAAGGMMIAVVAVVAFPVVTPPTSVHPMGARLLMTVMAATLSSGVMAMMAFAVVATAVVAAAMVRCHMTIAVMTIAMMPMAVAATVVMSVAVVRSHLPVAMMTVAMMAFAMMTTTVVLTPVMGVAVVFPTAMPGHVPVAMMPVAVMPFALHLAKWALGFVPSTGVRFVAAMSMPFVAAMMGFVLTAGLQSAVAIMMPVVALARLPVMRWPATRVLAMVLAGKILHESGVQLASLFRAHDALDDLPHFAHSFGIQVSGAWRRRMMAFAPSVHRMISPFGTTIARSSITGATITIARAASIGAAIARAALFGGRRRGRIFGWRRVAVGGAHFNGRFPGLIKPRLQAADLASQLGQLAFELFHFTLGVVVVAVGRLPAGWLPCAQGCSQRHDAQISQHTLLLG